MQQKKILPPMLIIGFLFFVFGFVSWLNAILIPYFKLSLQLTLNQAMMVTFAFYVSYFIMALPSSYILKLTGYKNGMMWGLLVMAAGALLFLPAAQMASYPLFLAGLFVQAAGLTLLQTASNPYVTILGPLESAASRMSLMGVCNKVAGAAAPLVFLNIVTAGSSEIDDLKQTLPNLLPEDKSGVLLDLLLRLRTPYAVVAGIFALMGLVIFYSGLPEIKQQAPSLKQKQHLFQFPQLVGGIIAIFCGVSVEVLAVDSIISYAEYQGYSFGTSKYFASITLVFMILSYLVGIWSIPRYLKQHNALTICAVSGIMLTLGILLFPGLSSVWMLAALGFCNALIWPTIWPLALKDTAGYTERGAALLIMGIVGGAVTPLLFGEISERFSLDAAYAIMLPLYGYLLYYGAWGYKSRKKCINSSFSDSTN